MLFFLAVCVVVVFVGATEPRSGNSAAPSRTVLCDFENNDLCDWESVDNERYLRWRTAYFAPNRNHYAQLNVDGHPYSKGRLASPWFTAPTDHRCQVEFIFFVGWSYHCRLTVIQKTRSSGQETHLWNSTGTPDTNAFSEPISLWVECTGEQYRIVFEGERLSGLGHPCYSLYNEIDVDNIVLYLYPEKHSTSASSTIEIPTTTLTTSFPSRTSETTTSVGSTWGTFGTTWFITGITAVDKTNISAESHADNTTGRPNAGALTGIIIAVLAAFVAAVVVFIFVRRRKQDGAKRGHWFIKCFERNRTASSAPNDVSPSVANVFEDLQISVATLSGEPARSKGGNPDSDHGYTAPDEPFTRMSSDNNSPNGGYELAALPRNLNGAGAASQDVSSSNYYAHLHSKGWKGPAHSAVTTDDAYDQVQQASDFPALPDEYAVPHAERKSKPSDTAKRTAAGKNTAAKGNVVFENTAAKGDATCESATAKGTTAYENAKGSRAYENATAKGSAVYENTTAKGNAAYQNTVAEDYDHLRPLADWKQGGTSDNSLARNDYSLASNVGCSTPAEAAVVYALARTTDYEVLDDDGSLVMSPCAPSSDVSSRLVTSTSANSGDVYNRLNTKGGPAVGKDVHQNHYDRLNDPAGTGVEYNSLYQEGRTRDQQREMAAVEYSHV